jgi:hypothetical protein
MSRSLLYVRGLVIMSSADNAWRGTLCRHGHLADRRAAAPEYCQSQCRHLIVADETGITR